MDNTIAAAVASVITAFFAALFTYLGVRNRSKVDVQASLNNGFNTLVSELQEEREILKKERHELRNMVMEQDKEILDLNRRVDRLLSVTTSFHNFIVINNLVPPPFEEEDVLGHNYPASP